MDGVCSYLVSTLHVTISSPESDRSRRSENVAGPSILTPSQLEIITRPNLVVELVKVVYEKGFQHPFNPFCIILKKLGSRMVDHHWGRQHKSVHGASKRRRSGNATSYAFSTTSTNVCGWGLFVFSVYFACNDFKSRTRSITAVRKSRWTKHFDPESVRNNNTT